MGLRLRRLAAVALTTTALTWAACGGSGEKQATSAPAAASQPSTASPSPAAAEPAKPSDVAQTPSEPAPDDAALRGC